MKALLMLNWGIGLEILKAVFSNPGIEVYAVTTRHDKNISDKWFNAVFNYAARHKIRFIDEKAMTFTQLEKIIRNENIELLLIHSFMKKLPKKIYSLPACGAVNIHPSLLPKYRGPSPGFWVLKNKEKITGLTSHYIDGNFDTGDIISQVKFSVRPDDTVESIIERQKTHIKRLVSQTLTRLCDKNFRAIPQQEELSSFAPKPKRKTEM